MPCEAHRRSVEFAAVRLLAEVLSRWPPPLVSAKLADLSHLADFPHQ